MIYENPDLESDKCFCRETYDYLTARYSADIGWINTHFFSGIEVVRVLPEHFSPDSNYVRDGQSHKVAFDWALNMLEKNTAKIELLDARLAKHETSAKKLWNDLSEKDQMIVGLKDRIDRILNSVSWKTTTPLRLVEKIFRKH